MSRKQNDADVLKNAASLQQKQVTSLIRKSESYSGPLPHPDMLAKFDKIGKGTASRIIRMAEKQSDHRQKLESKVIEANIWHERLGMFFAFLITVSIISGGIFLIHEDKDVAGFTVLVSGLGIQFYNYYNQQKKEQSLNDRPEKSSS